MKLMTRILSLGLMTLALTGSLLACEKTDCPSYGYCPCPTPDCQCSSCVPSVFDIVSEPQPEFSWDTPYSEEYSDYTVAYEEVIEFEMSAEEYYVAEEIAPVEESSSSDEYVWVDYSWDWFWMYGW